MRTYDDGTTFVAPSETQPAITVRYKDAAPKAGLIRVEDYQGNFLGDIAAPGVSSGGGDPVQVYLATTGQRSDIRVGTATAPNVTPQPISKLVQTVSMARASVSGDGGEQMATFLAIATGDAANQVQTVGVYGGAVNRGISNGGSRSPDSCGVYAVGNVLGAGIGIGIGAFFNGRRETTTGKANGVQISCDNQTGQAGTYNPSGFSDTTGIWLAATGQSVCGVGIVFGTNGQTWDVGIAYNQQNPVVSQSFRDDGNAATSIQINGTHATAAIAVAATAGKIIVGAIAEVAAGAKLEVLGPNSAQDPLVLIGSTTNAQNYALRIRNSVGQSAYGISAGANQGMTGTASGDAYAGATTAGKFLHLGGTVSVVKVGQDNTLGFFNGATAAKQTVSGAKGANAALASLIAALVAHGLITDTTTA